MVQADSLRMQCDGAKKLKLVVIAGATAVGKSALAVEVAKKINGEIVGADSMQIYKGLNIGTGKITDGEMCGIEHHLIDVTEPCDDYSVSNYVADAERAIGVISAKGKIPVITGGTGLYLNALLNGFNFAGAPADTELRNVLQARLVNEGAAALHNELRSVDAVAAEKISVNDTKRILRALEIIQTTGKAKSEAVTKSESPYNYLFIVVTDERERLYDRINMRVDNMVKSGLVDEVRGLYEYRGCNSMKAIGYKEIVAYLNGETGLSDAVELIKKNSRNYAKRQMTYFRWMPVQKLFYDIKDAREIVERCAAFCADERI